MKKYIILALRYAFYISTFLLFDEAIVISPLIALIIILFLESKKYPFLTLILLPFIDNNYKIILIISFTLILFMQKYIYKNRIYALFLYISISLSINSYFYIKNNYNLNMLYTSLISFIILAIILGLYYYNKKPKPKTISLNDNAIHLTKLLGYLLLISIYNPLPILYYSLFIQLSLINNLLYSFIFLLISSLINLILKISTQIAFISYFSSSIVPLTILFELDYLNPFSIYYIIYSILAFITIIMSNKKVRLETNYVENLFKSFNLYLKELSSEYERLKTIKEIKHKHIENIQYNYCSCCSLNTECKRKLDIRYSFLANAINNEDNNIYYCPHYHQFYLDNNIEFEQKAIEYTALNELAIEIEYLYHQSKLRAELYNKFISDLEFYGYNVININVYLNSSTLYFSITVDKNKHINLDIIANLASKRFKEEIETKKLDNKNNTILYFYKKTKVKIEYSQKVLAKNTNFISGDNYYIKRDYNESYIFALSDGMGNGHRAYLESANALSLLKRLLDYHFSIKTTLKLLEYIYEIKCDYDSYATLDVLFINTANMKLNLYKMGSTSTYIIHNNDIKVLENKALPLKLDDLSSSYEIEYFKGDTILLISDGISDFITKDELKMISYELDSDIILEEIISIIRKKENNELKDDASLIVIKIL